jgi:hypothetical protein
VADLSQPSRHAAPHPSSGGARPAGTERAALADQARTLARHVLAALRARGYPDTRVVVLITYNPFTAQTTRRQVVAWEVGRCAICGDGAAGEAVCWLLADGEFGVSIGHAALEKRGPEDLPGLPAVVGTLRTLAGDRLAGLPGGRRRPGRNR